MRERRNVFDFTEMVDVGNDFQRSHGKHAVYMQYGSN
jgi:hypothetical protein